MTQQPVGNKLFQITEADLAELERVVPDLCSSLWEHLNGRTRTQFRRVGSIINDIRWEYGPPDYVEVIHDGPPGGSPLVS